MSTAGREGGAKKGNDIPLFVLLAHVVCTCRQIFFTILVFLRCQKNNADLLACPLLTIFHSTFFPSSVPRPASSTPTGPPRPRPPPASLWPPGWWPTHSSTVLQRNLPPRRCQAGRRSSGNETFHFLLCDAKGRNQSNSTFQLTRKLRKKN